MDGGLKTKYIVRKADTGEAVENCFVLRPGKDWAARYAVRAYADMTRNMALRDDLLEWVGTFPVSSYDPESARIDQSKLHLKPCPRCGGKGLIYYEGPKYYYAECEHCPLELHEIYFSAEEAAEAWNYRAEPLNDPLTLGELRGMDGEPVWNDTIKKWAVVDLYAQFGPRTVSRDSLWRELTDRYYRRKPEETTP